MLCNGKEGRKNSLLIMPFYLQTTYKEEENAMQWQGRPQKFPFDNAFLFANNLEKN